jgi:SOS-response transcriptional repressor LexA
MIEDGILDGDYVIIRQQKTAERGQTIVALINDEATIKRFDPQKNHIVLHPANPNYPPLLVKPSQLHIKGILVGLLRHST